MVAALKGDHVEAARTVAPLRLLMQEQAGGKHQPLLLALIDTAEGATEMRMQSIVDFDEYYCIGVEHDQIKLASFASPVAVNQLQAMPL